MSDRAQEACLHPIDINYVANYFVAISFVGAQGVLRKAGGNWVDGDRFFDREADVEALSERIRDGAPGCGRVSELAAGYEIDIPADVRIAMCRMLRCCVPHHVQQFFDCLHEDLRRGRRRSATLADARRVYSSDMLGIRGQIDLEHYEPGCDWCLATARI